MNVRALALLQDVGLDLTRKKSLLALVTWHVTQCPRGSFFFGRVVQWESFKPRHRLESISHQYGGQRTI